MAMTGIRSKLPADWSSTGRGVWSGPSPGPIWDRQFQDGGRRVAWSFGFLHGGVQGCVLADVDSGRTVSQWSRESGAEPPDWANLCIE
jgi:hypothetical protein